MAEQISLEALAQRKSMQPVPAAETENTAQLETQIEELTPEQRNRVNEIKESIDLMDSQAAIQYGVGAQRNISNFADNILTQIRSKDSGYVGDMMSELMIKVKDVGVDKLGEESFLDKLPILKDASRSLRKFMQRYETLEVQIDRIEGELDRARMELLKDIGCSIISMKKIWIISGSFRSISRPEKRKSAKSAGRRSRLCVSRHGRRGIL